jgi:hypothetical protein
MKISQKITSVHLIIILLITLSTQGLGYAGEEEDDCDEKTITVETTKKSLKVTLNDEEVKETPCEFEIEVSDSLTIKVYKNEGNLFFEDVISGDEPPERIVIVSPDKELEVEIIYPVLSFLAGMPVGYLVVPWIIFGIGVEF